MLKRLRFFLILLLVTACQEEITPLVDLHTIKTNPSRLSNAFYENFEAVHKTTYDAETRTLTTGTWYFEDALIGEDIEDNKYNTSAIRLRYSGRVAMDFDITEGAAHIRIQHGIYGRDQASDWQLWVSTDSGETFEQLGETQTASFVLSPADFTLNQTGNIRLEIRKVSGGANRLNIDDVEVVYYSLEPEEPDDPVIPEDPAIPGADNSHILFGNPSGATTNVANENNYLMDKGQYVLSYNRSRATANWVSWHVDASSFGSGKRQDNFRSDPALPAGWYRVSSTSYQNSGFDRGHNCPSGDRTESNEINGLTFFMTNMIPQAPNNNQRTWANLEEYTRKLVQQGNEVYVTMGVYGTGGTGSKGYADKINNGNITVPNRIWKVIVVLPQGNNDLARVTTGTRVIAIDTPNDHDNINAAWGNYRVSVDAIEAATGYNLLSELDDAIENVLEAGVDNGPVN